MILVVCATELELQPLLEKVQPDENKWTPLVTGVGVVETTLTLSRFLDQHETPFEAVLHFGVAGAYLLETEKGADLLDICLADEELFGDFGICHEDHFEPLATDLTHKTVYPLDKSLAASACKVLREKAIPFKQGKFVTVAGVSATSKRGDMLVRQYGAVCENMEGAAVARVCEAFSLPLLEMRCISNFVEDRDLSRWELQDACVKGAAVVAMVLQELIKK